jgi:ribonuclease HI
MDILRVAHIESVELKDTQENKEIKKETHEDSVWTMKFDGAYSKEGSRPRVIFTSPRGKPYKYSFSIKFECTKNVAKYEALLLGLRVVVKHKIRMIRVLCGLELIVSQIIEKYGAKNEGLKQYRNVVWDYIEMFDAFSIEWAER